MMSRLRNAALGLSFVVLATSGCTEKKAAPVASETATPPPPAAAAAPKAEEAPAVPAEPRAAAECAAPIAPGPETDVKIGDRTAKAMGARLRFTGAEADGTTVLGVLGPINEDSGANLLALRKYLKFFQDGKADAIVVTGDVGEISEGISRALKALAEAKLPVFVLAGNRECRGDYVEGLADARKAFSNIVDLNQFRSVELGNVTLVSLPGYHDPSFINCATGCRYYKSTVDEVIQLAKEAKKPAVLVAHGPPHGEGSQSLDYALTGGNVGDPEVNRAIDQGAIPFGLFSNIKEAGARASSDPGGTTLLKSGTSAKTLYLNPGPADTERWEMNDKSRSYGMAALVSFKDGAASYALFRGKALTPAEKAEAKKLNPPPRSEGAQESPPPGSSAAPKP